MIEIRGWELSIAWDDPSDRQADPSQRAWGVRHLLLGEYPNLIQG